MLGRAEVNSPIIKNISTLQVFSPRQSAKKNNIIRKSIFLGKIPLNLCLPTITQPNSIKKPKPLKRKITLSPVHQCKSEVNLDNIFLSAQSEECSKIITEKQKLFKKLNDMISMNDFKSAKHQRSITQIINEVKKNKEKCEKNRSEKIKNYFNHALQKKINPKSIDMLYSIDHSRNDIHLQKLVLNIEYKNEVTNKKKFKKDEKVNFVLNEKVFNLVREKLKNKNSRTRNLIAQFSLNNFQYKTELPSLTHTSKSNGSTRINSEHIKRIFKRDQTRKRTTVTLKNEQELSNQVLHTEEKTNQEKEDNYSKVLGFDSELFAEKYKNIYTIVNNEIVSHYQKKVLSKDEIDFLTKNRMELLIDKLKDEYIDKYNKYIEKQIGNNFAKRNKEKLIKNNPNIKESIFRKNNDIPLKTEEQKEIIKSKLHKILDLKATKQIKLNLPFNINIDDLTFK